MGWTFVEGSTDEVVAALTSVREFTFDFETSGLTPPESRQLLWQIGTRKDNFVIRATADVDRLIPFLASPKWTTIIHNAKFEQKFTQYYQDTVIMGVFDTMLAEQVLESEKFQRGLAYVVEKYTGKIMDKTSQKSFIDMHPQSIFTQEQLQYASDDVEFLWGVYDAQKAKLQETGQTVIAQVEFDCAAVVAAMEMEGIPLDTKKWRNKISEYHDREKKTRENLFSLLLDGSDTSEQLGMFERAGINLKSPKQVANALINIGIDLPKNSNNNYMTDERTLERIDHPAARELLEYRGIVKVIDSYGESLLSNIRPFTGRLHPDFNQIGAETGRFSCREPNVQQIPEEFREFVGGVDGYSIVGADFGQMELRIIAEICQDPALIKAFNMGGDPHTATAALMFNIPPETVDKKQRHVAKTINFGLSYGMGAQKLMDEINKQREDKLTIREVYKLNDRYRETYRGVINWFAQAGERAYRQGYSETLGGRKRYFHRPSGIDADSFKKQIAAIKRQGGNAPIQGSNADITKMALVAVHSDLRDYGYRAKIINTVHDEIVLLAHKSQAESIKEIVADSMLRASQELIKSVPVKVDTYINDWWAK